MTSITKLFKIITANDYESLNCILSSNKTVDLNCYKSGQSLISKAIEVRAKECFDIIIEHSSNPVLKNKHYATNGLIKALEYYILASNSSNEYYLQRILEKDIEIEAFIICKIINNPNIFQQLINRITNDFNNLSLILYESVRLNNIDIFNIIYQKILELDLNISTHNTMYNNIFDYAINSSNLDVINTIKNNFNWKKYRNSYFTIEYPIIYHMIVINNQILFEYFYNEFEKLSEEEINQIPNIRNLNTIFECINRIFDNKTYNFIKNSLDKIYKLPIKFNDASKCISKMIELIILYDYYSFNYHKYSESNEILFKLMYWFLSNNKVQSNPIETMIFNNLDLYYKNSESRLKNVPNKLFSYKSLFKKILYLMETFNYQLSKQIKDKFESYYGIDTIDNWTKDKKIFIDYLAGSFFGIAKESSFSSKARKGSYSKKSLDFSEYLAEEKVKTFSAGSLTNLAKPKLLSSMLDFESKDSKLAGSLSKKSLDFSDNLAEEKVKTFSSGSQVVIKKTRTFSKKAPINKDIEI
jgi:hypothetical protein